MKVNQETRGVLKKELPWLPDLLSHVVGEFKVEVFDLDALNMRPGWHENARFRIYLLDKDGKKIGEVGRVRHYHKFSWLTRKVLTPFFGPVKGGGYPYDEWFTENLEEAIERLKPESWKTQFVLNIDGYKATLYKMGRGRSLDVQLEAKRQEEQVRLAKFLQDN